MSLPIELEKAIGDEKANRPAVGTDHDLAELIEKHSKPKSPPKEEKKESVEQKDKEDTKSDGEKATELLTQRLGFNRKTKKEPDEKKEEKSDKPDEAPGKPGKGDDRERTEQQVQGDTDTETAKTPDVGTETEKPKKAKISKKPDIDPIEIASAAAARTAQAFVESQSSQPKADTKADTRGVEDLLSDEEKGELEVFREMAKDARFKELPRQYMAYLKKAEDYQRQWEKDHPNEEFNPDAGDHDQFYAKHQPKYSELEYKKAIVRMESKASQSGEIEKLTKEQKRLQAELAAREMDPIINQTSIGALAEVIKGVDENILNAIQKDGFDKYAATNETEADLIRDVASRIGPFIAGILQFDDPDGRIPLNEKNPAHMEAVRYLKEKEDELRKKPSRERATDEGKILVPRAEYFRMSEVQKSYHAYLDTQMLIQLRIQEEAERATAQYQKDLKKAEARAKALGWLPPSRTENGHKEEPKKEEKAPPAKAELKSPEAASPSRVDTTGATKSGEKKDILDLTHGILFRR